PGTADLVGSWTSYQRLSWGGIGPASLEELFAGPRATVPPASPSTEPEPAVVDVRSLVYRGDRALARAQELRAAARQATGDSLLALVDEVCDLVALALEPNPVPLAPNRPVPSRWAWIVGLGITLGLLAWALHGVNARDLVDGVRRADRGLILATVALATLTFPIRTVRWRLILRDVGGGPYPVGALWHATAIGFMANNLLPVRAGDFARAYVASRPPPVRFSTALASVGVERVFDGLMLVSLMSVAIASS